jgi:1-acyl-sn-glycerol-3-phosphate acyltransferase
VIPEQPHPLRGRFVRWVLRRKLRAGVSAVRVLGLEHLTAAARLGPVLVCGNHVAFWDGLLIAQVTDLLGLDTRVLMRADQLRKAPLLRWAGCFGLEAGDPKDGARAVRHAAALLDRPGRVVWVFPQGEQRPQWARPLGFSRGHELILRRAPGAALVPLALHYEVGEREQPEAWLRFGPPLAQPRLLEASIIESLQAVQAQIQAGARPAALWPEPARLGEGAASRLLARWLLSGDGRRS